MSLLSAYPCCILTIVALFCQVSAGNGSVSKGNSSFYELDPVRLRELWHITGIRTMIKARVRSMLPYANRIDVVLYRMCENDAKNTATLALCATRIISTAQKNRALKEYQDNHPEFYEEHDSKVKKDEHVLKRLKRIMVYRKINDDKEFRKRRRKREAWYDNFAHLEKLEELKYHFDRVDKVKDYYSIVSKENDKFLASNKLPLSHRPPGVKEHAKMLDPVVSTLNNFASTQLENDSKISLLSPRLLSIIPESKKDRPRILSPTLLSFQKDGYFSLQDILEIAVSNEKVQQTMLELIMRVSGAGEALEKVMKQLDPEIENVRDVHFPLIAEMSKNDFNFMKAQKSMSHRQKQEMNKYGITFLTIEQMDLMYNVTNPKWNEYQRALYAGKTREDHEQSMDDYIAQLADLKQEQKENIGERYKRQATIEATTEPAEAPRFDRPFAFTNFIAENYAWEASTLSPGAFFTELLITEFGVAFILSPHVFLASILAPTALATRILSPTAFRAEILSPRMLHAWILTPEAFVAEILTPRFLEPRILSPDALVVEVLSPGLLSPDIVSPEYLSVLVLSPDILSPRILSEEKMIIEILSPHILGGHHEKPDSSVISIGGGEHEHEHQEGDEGSHHHQGDIHIHHGENEPADAHTGGRGLLGLGHGSHER